MKKFTYVLAVFFALAFSWQSTAQYLSEDFTGQTLPTGWTNVDNGTSGYVWEFNDPGGRALGAPFDADFAILDSDNYGSGASDAALVSATFDVSGAPGGIFLNFDQDYNDCCGSTTTVEVFDGATWTVVYSASGTDLPLDSQSIDITTEAGGSAVAQVRFTYTGDFAWWWAIDNVQVVDAPSCLNPTALTASNITQTQADLSWTAGGTEILWNIEWGVAGFTQGNGTTVTGVTNPYTLTGLTADTNYDYYVQADCAANGTSSWAGPYTLYTGHCLSVPSSNDGAGISNVQLQATDFPTGDVTYFDHTGTVIDIAQNTTANLQVTFETGYTYDTNVWIDFNDNLIFEASEQLFDGASLADNPTTLDASFPVDIAAALGNHKMRLGTADTGQQPGDPCYNGTYGVTLDFMVNITAPPACLPPLNLTVTNVNSAAGTADLSWTDANAPSNDFTYSVEDITNGVNFIPNTLSGGATTVGITGLVAGNDYSFSVFSGCGLAGNSTVSGPLAWNQTDLPDCVTYTFPLDGAVDVIGGITPLTWTEPGTGTDPTGYDIYFGQTSGALANIGTIPFPSTGINITGTAANTTYYWMIVPVNAGGGNFGCGEFSFTTAAAPTAPTGVTCTLADPFNAFTEEFDAQGTWTGDIGSGNDLWNFGQTGGTVSGSTGPSGAHSGSNYMYFEASGANSSVALANSPAIDLTGASEGAELSFFLHAYGAGIGRLDVLVSTDGGATYTYEDSWGAQLQTANADAWVPMGVNLDAYLGQTINIQLRYISTNSFTGDMAIDLFEVNTCQTIACPAPVNLSVINISTVTVDISWDVEPNATNYNWEIQPSGNAQGDAGVIASGVDEPFTTVINIAGPYIPGADYTLYVRSNCGGGSNSTYSSANFSIPPGAEDCANVIDLGTLTSPYSSTTAGATNDFGQDCLTNAGAPDRIYSILVPDGYTLVIGQTANSYDSKHRLAYGGACPGTTLIDCVDDPDLGDITWENTTGADETAYWIQSAFSTGSGDFTLAWTLTPPPTCFPPTNLIVSDINQTNVDLSWDAAVPAPGEGYYWEIQPQGNAPGDIGMISSGSTAAGVTSVIDASGPFVIGDTYTLYVNSICATGVDESTFTSVDFSIPYNGNCGVNSNTPNVAIPDNDPVGVTDIMAATGNPGEYLTDLNVYIGITHTYTGDLTVTLTSPSGTSVELFNTCAGENNLDVEFDDGAPVLVCGTPGVYAPANPLAAFNGEVFIGNWTLTVVDGAGGDTGTLDQWCLIPGFTTTSAACGGIDTTWNGVWSSGAPGPTDRAFIILDYDTNFNGALDACELWIDAGVNFGVGSGNYILIGNDIINQGNIVVADAGSVVQINDNSSTINGGTISVIKQTTIFPGAGFSIIGSPMTGTDRTTYEGDANITWVRNHTTANFVRNTDVELVIPGIDNWADDNGDNWTEIPANAAINVGEGYLVGGVGLGGTTILTNYTQGTLNNGVITFTPVMNAGIQADSPNILSNPYASGLNVNDFLLANPDAGGAVYFWEHLTPPSNGIPGYNTNMNYSMGDISMHNGLSGTAAANGGAAPSLIMPSAQGFGIKPTAATAITFTNSMRNVANVGYRAVEIDELHLNIINDTYNVGANTTIAFSTLTEDGLDSYDVERLGTFVSLYTSVADMKLGIQMRTPFNVDHVVSLGFSTLVEEEQTYKISISDVAGGQIEQATVYLIDSDLDITTNLSETDYTFTANVGEQKDRFLIVFTDNQLGNSESNLSAISVYPNPTKNILNIVSPVSKVNSVIVHDISGRKVATYDFTNNLETKLDVTNYNSGVYFVEINTVDGSVTKRIIRE